MRGFRNFHAKNGLMTTKLFGILILMGALSVVAPSCAQKQKSVKKMQQEHFDRQAEQQKAAEEAREEGLKRHKDIQSKETKKRMKRSEKKARRYKDNRKEPFLKRLFTKKRR